MNFAFGLLLPQVMSYRIKSNYKPDEVSDFRSLKGKGGHFEKGLFIAESEKIARKTLESSLEIVSAYLTEEQFNNLLPLFERRNNAASVTDIFIAPKSEMEQVIGYHLHQGVMLAIRIPDTRSLEEAMAGWKMPWMAVVLDGIADAENMGSIIRNAAAFGVKAVIMDGTSCNPWLRRSVRVSMGTIVDVEIILVNDVAESLNRIGYEQFVQVFGATLADESVCLSEVQDCKNVILVFGSEGWGLRKEVAAACDTLIRIPMSEGVDSLNVGVASGIFLYEIKTHIT